MNKAVFLDRDGVVNLSGAGYVNSVRDFHFMPGLFEFGKHAIDRGYKLIIVTNQGGIACGHIALEDHQKIMDKVFEEFIAHGCPLSAYIACPHIPPTHPGVASAPNPQPKYIKKCGCRKPGVAMFHQAKHLFDIDFSKSVMIGDRQTDIEAAVAAGIPSNYLFNQELCLWPTL